MDQYWASVSKEEIGSEMMDRVLSYKDFLSQSGQLEELRKSYRTYYGSIFIEDVDQSLKAIHINHYANLIRHIHVMVTGTRPAWEPRAVNSDTESQGNTALASGLLDFYMREKKLDKVFSDQTELALFLKEGWVSLGWNVTGGEVHGVNPEDGSPIYEGDIEFSLYNMTQVSRDFTKKNMKHSWLILEDEANKWDLAAKFPELAEKITALSRNKEDMIENSLVPAGTMSEFDSDMIPIYTLRHEKTDAMPQGRLTIALSDDVVLFDGPLPYKGIYTYCLSSASAHSTAFGHSQTMDILPVQDAFDSTVSAILTNQAANAVQNFQVPKGAAPKVTQLMGGMNVWETDPKAGKMEPLNLLQTAPEVFNFANFLQTQAELVSGVNQISRGNAPATLSGSAMALIQQQAIQFSSGVQAAMTSVQESVGTGVLELLQTFAVVPRIAMIAGKTKRTYMKQFKGEDLKGITRVIIDTANPLTKTTAGRIEIANQLLQTPNMIKTPEQYISVLTTGNLEPLYEHERGALDLMRSENEFLMDGKEVKALLTDDHALHILEHSSVLNSPESRGDMNVVQVTLAHIQEHINLSKGMDPALAAMLKQASFAAPPSSGGPAGPGPAQVMTQQTPVEQQASQVNLPSPAQPPPMPQTN